MINKMDKLTGLIKSPIWAMLRSELDALFAEALNAREIPDTESNVRASEHAIKIQAAKIVAERFQETAPTGTKTAVIPIIGPLSMDPDCIWYGGTTYSSIQDALAAADLDPTVGEIILLVDSPGGNVIGLPETANQIYNVAQRKNVTAMVTGMAASAAYWLTSQAKHIMLTPSGYVGSVGVITMHADISKMLENAGVTITQVFAGKYKTEWSPYAPLTDEDKAATQAQVDSLYETFLESIKRGRGGRVTKDGMESNFGDGRLLDASQAQAAGMVDMIANVRDAFKARAMRLRQTARAREIEIL